MIRQMPTVTSQAMRVRRDIDRGLLSRTRDDGALHTRARARLTSRELSADIRAGVVLDAGGERLAGDDRAGRRGARAAGRAASVDGATGRRRRCSPRATSTHAIVVVTGPFALPRVTRHDLRTALSALGGQTPPDGRPRRFRSRRHALLLRAVEEPFRRRRAV